MFSKRLKNLKTFIKNNGDEARNRVGRANIKLLLAMRKGMNESMAEVKLYARLPLERVGQFLKKLKSVWIPSSMRGTAEEDGGIRIVQFCIGRKFVILYFILAEFFIWNIEWIAVGSSVLKIPTGLASTLIIL